jgi:membrane fusion protein, multidrug efflux system
METNPIQNMKTKLAYRPLMIVALLAIIVYSCGGPADKNVRLQELKQQRDNLNKEIRALEKEIVADGGAIDAGIKIPTVVARKVEKEVFSHYLNVRGTIESDNNIFVPAMRPYVVTKILVREGDKVSKGQLMAELDNESITQTIREIENGLELATTLYERQKNLREKNIGTEVQFLQAKTSREDLEIKLKTAQNELDKTRIFSPINGIVDFVAIKEGEAAAPNVGAIRVSNLSSQKVVAKVSENYISTIHRGDEVTVYLPVIGVEFRASITAVSQVIDPNNRTIDIEVKLPDDERINPNMLAIITLNDYTNPSAIMLPINAVQRTEKKNYVYVATKNNNIWTTKLKDVEIGKYGQDEVEITGGLNAGDVVITFGFNNISAGDPVNLTFNQL